MFDNMALEADRVSVMQNEDGWLPILQDSKERGAATLPVTEDGKFILVAEEYDTVTGSKLLWNIPRIVGKRGECTTELAIKGTFEKTGIPVPKDHLVKLGAVNPDIGLYLDEVPIFAAILTGLPLAGYEPSAETKARAIFTADQIYAMANTGKILDGFTFAAIALWQGWVRANNLSSGGMKNLSVSVSSVRPQLYQHIIDNLAELKSIGALSYHSDLSVQVSISWVPGSPVESRIRQLLGFYS